MAEESKPKPSWIDLNWKAITLLILAIAGWTNLRIELKELQVQMRMVLAHQRRQQKITKVKENTNHEVRLPVSGSVHAVSPD